METKEIRIIVQEYASIDELPENDRKLLITARETTSRAYAPYSGFKVGAAVELGNGEIVEGSNQENMAYPSGLCAERVALFYAGSKYPDQPIKAMAITAVNQKGELAPVAAPCGACRQVMLESEVRSETPMRLILDGEKIIVLEGIGSLLPFSFSKDYL